MSTLTGELNIVQNLTGELNKNLEYVTPELQEKTITPTKQTQNVIADEDYDALSKVVVNPIPNEYIIPNYQSKNITITQNGTQNVTPDSNYDGLDEVSIVTAIPEPVYQTKNITIVQNGVQEITPDANYDGLSKVNVTTNIPAPVLQEKTITPTSQTQNVTPDSNYDGLSKVVVNGVSGYVDWSEIGYSDVPQCVTNGYNYAKQIYDNWDSSQTNYDSKYAYNNDLIYMPLVDTSKGTTFKYMFHRCVNLINVPQLDTSSGTTFERMFSICSSLKYVPQLDTSNCSDFTSMFDSCVCIDNIPLLNTSKGTKFYYMFSSCTSLTTIPQIDTSSGTNFEGMFNNCPKLTTIPLLDFGNAQRISSLISNADSLTTLGGFKDFGKAFTTWQSAHYNSYKLYLSSAPNLTHESLMNVINNLYDIASKGCNTQDLILGNTNLAKLTAEEIAIATNKGWNVS